MMSKEIWGLSIILRQKWHWKAGELILKHEDLQNIMDTIIEHHVTKEIICSKQTKPKAILLCCTTGLGTTDKMKMLLQGCLEGIDIDVVEMTYAELSTEGKPM